MLFSTEPLNIVDYPADADHQGRVRSLAQIRFIVLHHTAGLDSRDWLSRTSHPPVSIHRNIARDGTIYKILPDERVAWHVGPAIMGPFHPGAPLDMNEVSLGIELENLGDGSQGYPGEQLWATALQVVEYHGRYGILPILNHWFIQANKNDPYGFPKALFDHYYLEALDAARGVGKGAR